MLLAIIASIIIFTLDSQLNYLYPVRTALAAVVYPIQTLASMPNDIGNWMQGYFQDRKQLQEKIFSLGTSDLLNNFRIQKMQVLEHENMALRGLLHSSSHVNEHVIIAKLLMINLSPFSQQVLIDKGYHSGVFSGQPVLDSTGVMGQVTEVTAFSSRVVLLTNPRHGIPVKLRRNGLRAIATGGGLSGLLKLRHLPKHSDVCEGDLLVTSGLGGRFPAGYPVGTITSISSTRGQAFSAITVTPAAKIDLSSDVLLVSLIVQQ